jgi:hypothetical protein
MQWGPGWKRVAIIHGMIALAACWCSYTLHPRAFASIAPVVLGQLILLNIWFTLSKAMLRVRCLILIVFAILLQALSMNPSQWSSLPTLMIQAAIVAFIPSFLIVVPMVVVILARKEPTPSTTHKSQFQIRTLLALTALAALTFTLKRIILSTDHIPEDGSLMALDSPYSILVATIALIGTAIGFVSSILAAVWSCLGNLSRLPACMVVIAIVCAVPLHSSGQAAATWAKMFATAMTVVILSLLYVRAFCLHPERAGRISDNRAA